MQKDFRPGEPLSASWVNEVNKVVAGLKLSGSGGIGVSKTPGGWNISNQVDVGNGIAVAHFGQSSGWMTGSPFNNVIYAWPPGYPNPTLTYGYARIYQPARQSDGTFKYKEITADVNQGDLVLNLGPFTTSSGYLYEVRKVDSFWVLSHYVWNAAPYYEVKANGLIDSGKLCWLMDPTLPANEVQLNHGRFATLINSGGGICTRIKILVGDQFTGTSIPYHIQGHFQITAAVSSTAGGHSSSVQLTTSGGYGDFSNLNTYGAGSITAPHFISAICPIEKDGYVEVSASVPSATGLVSASGRMQIIPIV